MFRKRMIPCLLLKGDGLVKTVGFKSPTYVGDPLNAVRIFSAKEADEIIFLDIEATRCKRLANLNMVERIAEESFMPLTVGGGVRRLEDVRQLLKAGCDKVAIGSGAHHHPQLIREAADAFGSQCIVGVIDMRRRWNGSCEVYTDSGTRRTRKDPVNWAQRLEREGAGELLVNDVNRDGAGQGYNLPWLERLAKEVAVPVVACGGAGHLGHIEEVLQTEVSGAAAGSLFVFHGPRRAVLINYPDPATRDRITRFPAVLPAQP